MNTLIILKGVQGSGKTHSLLKVRAELKTFGREISCKPHDQSNKPEDVRSVISVNGTRVGIATDCDHFDWLVKNIDEIKDAECKILICPAHTRGDAIYWNVINVAQKHGFTNEYVFCIHDTKTSGYLPSGIVKLVKHLTQPST